MDSHIPAAAQNTILRLKAKLALVRKDRFDDDREETTEEKQRMKSKLKNVAKRLKKLTSKRTNN
jgi:hypothetical protein